MIVDTPEALTALAARLGRCARVALDLEADGMHAYRPRARVAQLAWEEAGSVEVAVVDPMATSLAPLAPVLAAEAPVKVLHDLGFDCQLLFAEDLALRSVVDTQIMAKLLGRPQLGLAALLGEKGIHVDKALQHHDWRVRPLTPAHVAYLEGDVKNLFMLADALAAEVREAGIEEEVRLEVAYRISTSEVLPWSEEIRVKGDDRLRPEQRWVCRKLAMYREAVAREWDVPPHRVVSADVLVLLAERAPTDARAVKRLLRGRSAPLADEIVEVIRVASGETPAFEPGEPRPPRAVLEQRRLAEGRLKAWRKAEAVRRKISEQALLPGHCITDMVERLPRTAAELREVPGLGDVRVSRDGALFLDCLSGSASGR